MNTPLYPVLLLLERCKRKPSASASDSSPSCVDALSPRSSASTWVGSNGRFTQRARLPCRVKACGPAWPAGRTHPVAPPSRSCVRPQRIVSSAGSAGGALSDAEVATAEASLLARAYATAASTAEPKVPRETCLPAALCSASKRPEARRHTPL